MPKGPTEKAVRARLKLRCAIYTRKSSEEGLEQHFNSLDAQREACEAYIASQKHEGWMALAEMYDDGGFSGGTTERPALQRLLADVQAGRIERRRIEAGESLPEPPGRSDTPCREIPPSSGCVSLTPSMIP